MIVQRTRRACSKLQAENGARASVMSKDVTVLSIWRWMSWSLPAALRGRAIGYEILVHSVSHLKEQSQERFERGLERGQCLQILVADAFTKCVPSVIAGCTLHRSVERFRIRRWSPTPEPIHAGGGPLGEAQTPGQAGQSSGRLCKRQFWAVAF